MTAFKGLGTYGNAVGVVTPLDHKLAHSAFLAKTSSLGLIRPGVFYEGLASLVSGTANMSYNVAAYRIATQRSASAGVVFGGNDGTLNVPTTAAPGSNSRYDVIYHWPREYSLDGTNSDPVIGVIQGTAAASPTVPSLAAFPGAVELARILVPAGVTATNSGTTITQRAPFTTFDGSAVPVRNTTERDALTNVFQGSRVERLDADWIERYYALYNASTNPPGAKTAGWYPLPGAGPRFVVDATGTQALGAGANTLTATAFAGAPQEMRGFTSFTGGALTVAIEGDYDVTFSLFAVSGNPLVWVDGVQKLAGPASSQGLVSGIVHCLAGSVLTFRTFTGGAGNANPSGAAGTTQVKVTWAGVRKA